MAQQRRVLRRRCAGLALCLLATLPACQARPTPTPLLRSMTVTLTVPVADKGVISAAEDVFAERLTALGITNFTVTTGAVMSFKLSVPATFDAAAVDAVLHRVGLVEFVPWRRTASLPTKAILSLQTTYCCSTPRAGSGPRR